MMLGVRIPYVATIWQKYLKSMILLLLDIGGFKIKRYVMRGNVLNYILRVSGARRWGWPPARQCLWWRWTAMEIASSMLLPTTLALLRLAPLCKPHGTGRAGETFVGERIFPGRSKKPSSRGLGRHYCNHCFHQKDGHPSGGAYQRSGQRWCGEGLDPPECPWQPSNFAPLVQWQWSLWRPERGRVSGQYHASGLGATTTTSLCGINHWIGTFPGCHSQQA